MVVPVPRFDLTTTVPFSNRTRSRMLVSPSPAPREAVLTSNPTPESRITRWMSFPVARSDTQILFVRLCFTALCRTSCSTRKRQVESSFGRAP